MTKTKWESMLYNRNKLLFGWMPPHPIFFMKKKIYDQYGVFDLLFGSAVDYELLVRLLYRYNISCVYLPHVDTKMRIGGLSNITISKYELLQLFRSHFRPDIVVKPNNSQDNTVSRTLGTKYTAIKEIFGYNKPIQ